jgi:hypothetical protein
MANVISCNDQNVPPSEPSNVVAPATIVVLVAGMVAAWLAAGSTGLLGHPLQHALTWLALAVALVAGWPRDNQSLGTWAILAGSAVLSLFLSASSLPAVNVLAVAVLLAAVAQTGRGLGARVALIAALAAGALGLFRFACDSIPLVWLAAAAASPWRLVAGLLTGIPLQVGKTFGGLDFLVLMAAIYTGWLIGTAPPRRSRAGWAAAAIVAGHLVYLVVLAYSEKILAALPDMVVTPESDINRVGIWTWSNGLRMLFPWNVPLLAVAIDGGIAAVMFRWARWLPVVEPDPKELEKQKKKEEREEIPGSVLAADMLFRFGPPLLALAAALLVALGLNKSDLKGKTIVAYEKGYLNWLKPEYDSQADGFYGMLPIFVESLGGMFSTSKDLSERDLATADVLLLLHPDEPWSEETLQRVWDYVRRGGSLLLAADPVIAEGDSRSSFNDVLRPTAMQVRYDTAVTRTGSWEQSYELLAHPVTAGLDDQRNRFGFELGSSIRTRWPARPVVAGRWGWSDPGSDAATTGVSYYNAGKRLGDLVLAAEQPFGAGRIFVLGGTSPLRNEMLANAYPFVGRLLSYLAHKPLSPQAFGRQLLGLLALLALAALVALRPAAWQIMLTSAVLSVSLICSTAAGYWSGRVLPDGRARAAHSFNNIAYIDASHLEAYSSDLWANHGIAGLMRTLMRQGYLPLLATELTAEQLERAGLLISIAPAREFSDRERGIVHQFVAGGGTLICMVGAEDARASAPLLADFNFTVPGSPVPPGNEAREPEPLGFVEQVFAKTSDKRYVQFYAGWPLECVAASPQEWVVWSNGQIDRPIVVSHSEQGGAVVVIADTYFASNENLETAENSAADNIYFWRWLLSRVVPGQKPWDPPPNVEKAAPAKSGAKKEVTAGDAEQSGEAPKTNQRDKVRSPR